MPPGAGPRSRESYVRCDRSPRLIEACAHPLAGAKEDYEPLLELTGSARLALLGEASHGTHEFYRERAEITKRLITEQGFTAVAVEADWPDAYRVNRFVRGVGEDATSMRGRALRLQALPRMDVA